MSAMGRPKIEVDQTQFEQLCSMMCTQEEIAGFFHCSIDTISRWCKRTYGETFAEVYKIASAGGKISLRRAQFKLATKSAAMAIFLGKQYLGQRDDATYELEIVDDGFTQAILKSAKQVWNDGED